MEVMMGIENKSVVELKKELFRRNYNLTNELLETKGLQKELKDEFQFHKEFNPNGLNKDDVSKILKASSAKAKQDDLQGKSKELLELEALIDELED